MKGLSILKGRVVRFPKQQPDTFRRENGAKDACLKVPQIGWNCLQYPAGRERGRLFAGIPEGEYVYFVHSYYLEAKDPSIVTARAEYGITYDASVEQGNVFACQFHPEKSERVGMEILRNFLRIC